jgi:hypothetical protein
LVGEEGTVRTLESFVSFPKKQPFAPRNVQNHHKSFKKMAEKNANASEQSGTQSSATPNYWGWFEQATQNVKEFAEVAGKVVQEKSAALVKQAEEYRQNYDMEVATSILMGTVGGPVDINGNPIRPSKGKLTKQAMKELDLTYVTENIISMSFPCDFSKPGSNQTGNDIDVVSEFLKKKHPGRFMIWNISEESYDYGKFNDQVLEYKFPGHPSPPLGLLFKICTSVESWLDADERNVAVIHCLTGKGRTAALMACVMTWIGEFTSPMEALQYISDRRAITVDHLTIPSQRRYIQYFSNMLDGVKPRSEPLMLRRVIINCIPIFGSDTSVEGADTQGCCPYIQLFKNGKLIATAAAQGDSSASNSGGGGGGGSSNADSKLQLRWIKATDGSASFNIDCPVQGDILLRCRHVARSGVRVSMFRSGFHTGYVPSGVLRLTRAQLDGSNADPRFDEEFFVDLIFAPIAPAANISPEVVTVCLHCLCLKLSCCNVVWYIFCIQLTFFFIIFSQDINTSSTIPKDDAEAASASTSAAAEAEAAGSCSTDIFEQTLHRDAKFWETVATRKQKAKKRKARKFISNQQERFSIADDLKFDDELASGTEVNFYSAFTGALSAAGGGGAASAAKKDLSGLSDMDLIMQLAELEGTGTSSGAGDDGDGGGSGRHSLSEEVSFSREGAVGAGNGASNSSSSSSNQKQGALSSELQDLEDLERELGLDSFALFGGGGGGGGEGVSGETASGAAGVGTGTENASATSADTSTSTNRAAAPDDDDDNLDELEKYLQSLGTGGSS